MRIEKCSDFQLAENWRLPQLKEGQTSIVHRRSLIGATVFGAEVFFLMFGKGAIKAGICGEDDISMTQMYLLADAGNNTLLISSQFTLGILNDGFPQLKHCTQVPLYGFEFARVEISKELARYTISQVLTPVYESFRL